jgi:homogentisate phytyltransferase/homogentisate geranylgeranyltransferase
MTVVGTMGNALRTLVAFSRPHTIIGTSVSVVALAILADLHARSGVPAIAVVAVLIGSLAINVYIVGINQLADIDIDRINKPWLPVASGALPVGAARIIVWGCAALALVSGVLTGPYALAAYGIGFIVGSAYSLRPLRLKRYALWAALSIAGVRAFAVNLLLFAQFLSAADAQPDLPPPIVVLTSIILALSLVIAWFKDIPDMDGDRRFHVHTLTLRLGPRRVLTLGLIVMALAYCLVIVVGLIGVPGLHGGMIAIGHVLALTVLVGASKRVDLSHRPSIARFYLLIWGLFYAEYLMFPLAGLMA